MQLQTVAPYCRGGYNTPMPGPFVKRIRSQVLAEVFELLDVPDVAEQETYFPGGKILVIVQEKARRVVKELLWGLVPATASDPAAFRKKYHTWNARCETIDTSFSYRDAFRKRRCLIPATGYYVFSGPRGKKQRHRVELINQKPFACAGAWERWGRDGAEPLESCTVITTESNDLVRPMDARMPVILPTEAYERWLELDHPDPLQLKALLTAYPQEQMRVFSESQPAQAGDDDSLFRLHPIK